MNSPQRPRMPPRPLRPTRRLPLGPPPQFDNSVEHGDQRNIVPDFSPGGPPPRSAAPAPHKPPRPIVPPTPKR